MNKGDRMRQENEEGFGGRAMGPAYRKTQEDTLTLAMESLRSQAQRLHLHSVCEWQPLKVLNRGTIRVKKAGSREGPEAEHLLQAVGQGSTMQA